MKKDSWNETDYLSFAQYLKSIAQKKHAEFSTKITPGATNILGVKIPELRKIAKEITKGDWRGFLSHAKDDTFEEVLIQGIIIGLANMNFEESIGLIERYLPKIDNWAVCDCLCTSLKITSKHKEEMLILINKCFQSQSEFTVRFSLVMLLSYYIDNEHIEYLLHTLNSVKDERYYVKMAIAWAVSVCFVKFPSETMVLLNNNTFDDFVFNKAVDKMNDSFRIDKESKIMLKTMKKTRNEKRPRL